MAKNALARKFSRAGLFSNIERYERKAKEPHVHVRWCGDGKEYVFAMPRSICSELVRARFVSWFDGFGYQANHGVSIAHFAQRDFVFLVVKP